MTYTQRRYQLRDFQPIDTAQVHLLMEQMCRQAAPGPKQFSVKRLFWFVYNSLPHYYVSQLLYSLRYSEPQVE